MTDVHPLDRALTLSLRGDFESAEAIMRENGHDPRALFNTGWYECRRGNWRDAAVYLDVGRTINCYGSPPLRNGRPIWNEQSLKGKTVHLRCEGGYGDEIIGVRWARNFAELGARVHVSCSPGLASLFARAPGVSAVTRFLGADHVHCDYWVPAMSCPRWFEPTGESYLRTDPDKWARWGDVINSPRLRVGLRWAGNPKFEGHQFRRFPFELMLRLVQLRPDAQFYSLQVGNDLLELPDDVIDLGPRLTDWDETAAALSHLDLVITSCTGVAHCAAALGRPTWIVIPVMPYYLWAKPGECSQWYDSVKLFRQQRFGRWNEPFDHIAGELTSVKLEYDDSSFWPLDLEHAKKIVTSSSSQVNRFVDETEVLVELLRNVVRDTDVVLDYGCGVGRVSRAMIEKIGCRVVGVDNEKMLECAREHVASDKFTSEREPADVAVCIFVLQHAADPSQIVADIWRLLKPDCLLVTLDEPRRLALLKTPQDKFQMYRDDGIVLDDVISEKFDLVRQEDFPWRDSNIKVWRRKDVKSESCVA